MIDRYNSRLPALVDFRGGPSPRIPDSLFIPDRETRHPLSQSTVVVNLGQGFCPAPYLRNHHIPRIIPFNIVGGKTIIQQPMSKVTKLNRPQVTFRSGAPASLSSLIPPVG